MTEEEKKKRQADLAAYQARQDEYERKSQEHYWLQRVVALQPYAPPPKFGPDFGGIEEGKPLFFYGVTFEDFTGQLQPKAFKAANDFITQAGFEEKGEILVPGLLLIGPVGVGKTHLAAAIYNHHFKEWIDSGTKKWQFKTIFTTESRLLTEVRATFKADAEKSEEEVIAKYSGCDTLILDDLCKYEAADPRFRNRILFEVLDRLWTGDGSLIATSNYALTELTQMLGEPIADRIRDMCVVVEMKGVSQRGQRGRAIS